LFVVLDCKLIAAFFVAQ